MLVSLVRFQSSAPFFSGGSLLGGFAALVPPPRTLPSLHCARVRSRARCWLLPGVRPALPPVDGIGARAGAAIEAEARAAHALDVDRRADDAGPEFQAA